MALLMPWPFSFSSLLFARLFALCLQLSFHLTYTSLYQRLALIPQWYSLSLNLMTRRSSFTPPSTFKAWAGLCMKEYGWLRMFGR